MVCEPTASTGGGGTAAVGLLLEGNFAVAPTAVSDHARRIAAAERATAGSAPEFASTTASPDFAVAEAAEAATTHALRATVLPYELNEAAC